MRSLKKTSTTRRPQTLVDELQANSGVYTALNTARDLKNSRTRHAKQQRKQERQGAKQRKAQFFSAASQQAQTAPKQQQSATKSKRPSDDAEHADSPPKKKARVEPEHPVPVVASSHVPKSQKEKEEDAYIAYLEGKLGYDKKKKGKKEDDGLDDLFDFTESLGILGDDGISDEISEEEENYIEEEVEASQDGNDEDEEEWGGINQEDNDTNEDQDDDESIVDEVESASKPSTSTTYVPPHLRKQSQNVLESEVQLKLTRQLKGQLNRMTEQNIASILDSIEDIYRKNRRNDVTTTLTTLIIDGISSHSSLLDSFVVLYAAFVSSLHKIIGIEFAAHFVQSVVSAYEQHYTGVEALDANPEAPAPKECSNLIVLISELYNFQVISCVLVYDIIRGLLETELTEFNVDLLLKIVRNSGQQLRQDDPSSLKDIIQIVQSKISDHTETLSSRTRFMVETLSNLKNNKVKRNVTLNQGYDAVERMKKFLSGLGKNRHVMAHEPLRVSLQDLHSAERKGKWWLVGAAWGGDPLVEAAAAKEPARAREELGDNALLKLARKQGMNTDIRRSVFVVLMSSDDYVDACERLSQLNLTEVQQREIVRVLLHCCGNEKTYNPYYTLVAQHLCRSSHSYKITLQFCLWDFLRDLGEVNVGGAEIMKNLKDNEDGFDVKNISSSRMRNVARAYAWWIAKDCLTLAILKPVDFTTLKSQSTAFLRELFVQLFVCSQTSTPLADINALPATRNRSSVEEIFIKATRIETLAIGLAYFLTETLQSESDVVQWACGVAKDTLRTGVDFIPSL
ncbi:MIF4G/MA4-domain-containing protein [Mycena indigotica]|uniref:MIF4G/MA4-domain-containing protein n=1 Tax=Mycena indigotica TaxID=2126181 RepID=A0A8H6T7D7_9AGAR|nr:MIF4G/MA4-domain-containing protein [Mycena indigotica]KAF7312428.1 MIF4G/MA4-domain-containing protein [Mycena indigotica]